MVFTQIYTFLGLTKQYLLNLNLFQSELPATAEHELRSQRLATRLFLFLLSISFIILLIYTSIGTIDKTITIHAPNLQQYIELNRKYARTLECPCAHIAIAYDKFLTIDYELHHVCSSDFVSDEWFNFFKYFRSTIPVLLVDFRGIGQYAFQALRSICRIANETIADSLMRFNAIVFVSAYVVPPILFHSQTNSIVKQYQSTTTTDFLSSLRIIRNTTQANMIFSFLQSNSYITFDTGANWGTTYLRDYEECSCAFVSSCTLPMHIYNMSDLTTAFLVPGMYRGCYIFEALLQSDLRCFYNQTCFQEVLYYSKINISINITVMNTFTSSRFLVTATVEEMLDELMVDEWQWSAAYDRYFDECQPIYCSYTQTSRNDAIYIVTTTISLIGGLVTVLRLTVPRIVHFVQTRHSRRRFLHPNTAEHESRIRRIWRGRMEIYRFNLFASNPPTTDVVFLRHQLLSTRVFVSLCVTSLIALLIYISILPVIKTTTINAPTVGQYIQLYERHSQTLSCPCSHITTNYKDLFNISYTFHPVCHSDFVTDKWANYLLEAWSTHIVDVVDFRATSVLTFRALSSICALLNDTIANSLGRFYGIQLVNTDAIPIRLFQSQMSSQVDYFKSSTVKEFLSSLQLIRDTTQSNFLFSAAQTNAKPYITFSNNVIFIAFQEYNACSCALSATCSRPSQIFNEAWTEVIFKVPGMFTGCYTLEALLQSNLHCFYNQSCLQELMSYISDTVFVNITAMNSSTNKHFLINATVKDLLDELMVDQWQWSADYDTYFSNCQPVDCSFVEETGNDAIYIITASIGLIGGIVKALRLLISYSLLLIREIFYRNEIHRPINHLLSWNILRRSFRSLWHLNLFGSVPPATSQSDRQMQALSTRLFLLFLLASSTVLLVYTTAIPVIKTFTIRSPTLSQYTDLSRHYASTLVCPCNSIAVEHDSYLLINYTLHPICSSDFIEDKWVRFIQQTWTKYRLKIFDIRWQAVFTFQALHSFCQLADQMITNTLTRFRADRYISLLLSSPIVIQSQMNAAVNQFQASSIRELTSALQIVHEYTEANNLYSALRSNGLLYYMYEVQSANSVSNNYNGTCECGTTARCISSAVTYNGLSSEVLYKAPGLYVGCYVIEALLQSSLQCFYNQTCVQELTQNIDRTITANFTAINTSPTSHFLPTNSVEEILSELMVDQWQWSVDYEKYYDACEPIQCSHVENVSNDMIYIVTTLIGLVGGLVTTLKLTVPRAVFVFYHFFKKNEQVVPQVFTVEQHTGEKSDDIVIEDVN